MHESSHLLVLQQYQHELRDVVIDLRGSYVDFALLPPDDTAENGIRIALAGVIFNASQDNTLPGERNG